FRLAFIKAFRELDSRYGEITIEVTRDTVAEMILHGARSPNLLRGSNFVVVTADHIRVISKPAVPSAVAWTEEDLEPAAAPAVRSGTPRARSLDIPSLEELRGWLGGEKSFYDHQGSFVTLLTLISKNKQAEARSIRVKDILAGPILNVG